MKRLGRSQGSSSEGKKAILKGCILSDSIYITFLQWQNDRDGEQIGGQLGLGTGIEEAGGCGYKNTRDPCGIELCISSLW